MIPKIALAVGLAAVFAIGGCSRRPEYSIVGTWDEPPGEQNYPSTFTAAFRADGTFEFEHSAGPFKNGRSNHSSLKGTYRIEGSHLLTTVSGRSSVTTNADGSVYHRSDTQSGAAETASMEWSDADHVRLVPTSGNPNESPATLTRRRAQ